MARSVMIVDDIDFVRRTIAEILGSHHYQVIAEASNGEEAVELYAKLKPDVVIMDVVMPKKSGIEATRQIMKVEPHAKVVIISAMEQENIIMDAINAGARDYLVKPFTSKDLLRAIEGVLNTESRFMDQMMGKE